MTISSRETLMLLAVARGLGDKEIAYEFGLTPGTFKIYLSRLKSKLGMTGKNRVELALYVWENEWPVRDGIVSYRITPEKKKRLEDRERGAITQRVQLLKKRYEHEQTVSRQMAIEEELERWERIYQEKFADPNYYSNLRIPAASSPLAGAI